MPQATDITINNGATTPVAKTFNLIAPAAGDGGVAQWALREGPISSVFPTITVSANRTSNRSRKLTGKLVVPSSFQDSVTGLTNVGTQALFTFTMSVPDTFPEALKGDMVAFASNLMNTPLIKTALRDAYSLT